MLLVLLNLAVLMSGVISAPAEDSPSSAPTYDVIVIGLGASGVAAATTIAKTGRRVLGLEASDQIGGRVRTVEFGDGIVEMGAEWIHGTNDSVTYELAQKNNVSLTPDMVLKVYQSDGTEGHTELMLELLTTFYGTDDMDNSVSEDRPAEPLGDFYTRKIYEYLSKNKPDVRKDQTFLRQFLDFLRLMTNNYEGCYDWNEASVKTKFETLSGQDLMWGRNGYKTLFEILMNTYNNGPGIPSLETKLNKEVTQVVYLTDPTEDVVVKCKDGSEYRAKSVIVTVSLGVLKERHTTLFSPMLAANKINAIEKIPMGLIGKVHLAYDKIWWPHESNRASFSFLWLEEDKQKIPEEDKWMRDMFYVSRPAGADNVLEVWSSGDTTKKMETLPEDELVRKLTEVFRMFLGANVTVPEPSAMLRSTWFSNPFTRGTYTFDSLALNECPDCRSALAAPVQLGGALKLLFAGEGTHPTRFSTVHGAVETGYREARRLLAVDSGSIF